MGPHQRGTAAAISEAPTACRASAAGRTYWQQLVSPPCLYPWSKVLQSRWHQFRQTLDISKQRSDIRIWTLGPIRYGGLYLPLPIFRGRHDHSRITCKSLGGGLALYKPPSTHGSLPEIHTLKGLRCSWNLVSSQRHSLE